MKRARRAAVDEMVPLADRLRYLQVMRVVLVGFFLGYLVAVPEALAVPTATAHLVALAYAGGTLAGYGLWRLWRARGITLFGALLIADGFFLAWTTWATGGPSSGVRYLALVHVVTVALLASYRTSMKLALWHSLLALALFELADTPWFAASGGAGAAGGAGRPVDLRQVGVFVALVWAAAVTTAAFAAVNERELRRRKVDLEDLARLSATLESATTPEDVAEALRASLTDAFGFPVVTVLLVHDDELAVGASDEGPSWRGPLGEPGATMATAWAERRTQLVARLDAGTDAHLASLLGPVRNVLVAPLFADHQAVGAVVAEHGMRRGSRIERRVVTMVERFCDHAGLALRTARLLEGLRASAAIDGLTGVANRRTFDDTLRREVARHERTDDPLSLVLLDIDHFKALNDRHGHQAGDEVLRAAASALARSCRTGDVVARYGGEEFAVVLPNCSTGYAVETAERLRGALMQLGAGPAVTASFGVATLPHDGGDAEALVAAADRALYAAKRRGRNRVVVASDAVDAPR